MFARAICFILLMHWVRAASSRTFCTAGTSRAIRMAMMAITTSSSINVNARRRGMVVLSRGSRLATLGRSVSTLLPSVAYHGLFRDLANEIEQQLPGGVVGGA